MKPWIAVVVMLATGWLVSGQSTGQVLASAEGPSTVKTRVLHFPKYRCLGQVNVDTDPDPARPDPVRVDLSTQDPYTFGSTSVVGVFAQGDVVVPAGQHAKLAASLTLRQEDRSRAWEWCRPLLDAIQPGWATDDLSGLYELGPDDLVELSVSSLAGMTRVEERVLVPISHLTGLQTLSLFGTGATSKGMHFINELHSLRALELENEPWIGDAGLAVLKDLPALEYFACDKGLTDAGLKYLRQFPNLKWLRIGTDKIRGPGLADLAALPNLERLRLVGGADRHVQYLQGLIHLKGLTLFPPGEPCTDASLASIGGLTSLEDFHIMGWGARTDFTGTGVAHLRDLKNLKTVDFGVSSHVGDEAVRHLADLPDLESIENVKVTREGVRALSSLRNLKRLKVELVTPDTGQGRSPGMIAQANPPPLGDLYPSAVRQLGRLQSLEELTLTDRLLSDDDLRYLEPLGHLKRLSIFGAYDAPALTNKGMASICKLRQLELLCLHHTRVTKSGLNQLNCLTNLKSLDELAREQEADEATLDLSKLTSLRRLSISVPLQDPDLACLSALHHLEWLSVGGQISEGGLRYLKDLAEIKTLWISGLSCSTGDGPAHLRGLKRLDDLRLFGLIPDAAMSRLADLSPSLSGLWVQTPEPIQAKTIAHLKEALPRLFNPRIEKPDRFDMDEMLSRSHQQTQRQPPQIKIDTSSRR